MRVGKTPRAGRDVLAGVERKDAEPPVHELRRGAAQLLLEELVQLCGGDRDLGEVRVEVRKDTGRHGGEGRAERAARFARPDLLPTEVRAPFEERFCDSGAYSPLKLVEPRLLLDQRGAASPA